MKEGDEEEVEAGAVAEDVEEDDTILEDAEEDVEEADMVEITPHTTPITLTRGSLN